MKKTLIIICSFHVLIGIAVAQDTNYFSVGASFNTMSQSQTQISPEYKEIYSGVGLNMTAFTGRDFGLYSAVSFFAVNEFTAKSGSTSVTTRDMSAFDAFWGMDAQLGIGRRSHLNRALSILLGGGVNYSQLVAEFSNPYLASGRFSYGVMGVGGIAELTLKLFANLHLTGSFRGGYNFLALFGDLNKDGVEFGGGFAIAPAFGLGFSH